MNITRPDQLSAFVKDYRGKSGLTQSDIAKLVGIRVATVSDFDNLLTDSREIRERIVARFQAESTEPFDILTPIGRDCVGDIQLLPHKSQLPNVKSIDLSTLSEQQLVKTKSYPLRIVIPSCEPKSYFGC